MISKLQDIYDHELNVKLEWFWDGGIQASIGDDANGWADTETFDTVTEAIDWLWTNTVGAINEP